jgi:hypothetical protein
MRKISSQTLRMNRTQPVPIVTADAGDPNALADPNSPASLARQAKQQQTQAAADAKYDAAPPPPGAPEGFATEVIVTFENGVRKQQKEITSGLFLSLSVLLALYALAPSESFLGRT